MAQPGCGSCGGGQPAQPQFKTLDEWYAAVAAQPSDVNEHMPALRDLASKCGTVVEISRWNKPALIAFAAGLPKKLVSICFGNKDCWPTLNRLKGDVEVVTINAEQQQPLTPQASDLLFIDTWHQAEVLYSELSAWAPLCHHYIVIHCTEIFGETGDNGGPGVLPALRRWMKEHPEWSVIKHYQNNNGLTVLSRNPADKPSVPSGARQAFNFAKAMVRWKASGEPILSEEDAGKRLDVCATCEMRNGERCSKCGCPLVEGTLGIPGKAFVPTEQCPLGKW